MKTALLWSGGADSTFVLYKLLTETTDEVTAVVLETPLTETNSVGHRPVTNTRIPALIVELKKIRDFNVIVEYILDSNITTKTSHYYTYAIDFLANDINNGVYDRLATGRSWEQQDQSLGKSDNSKGTFSQQAAERLFDDICTRGELWNPLITGEYYDNFCRWHVLEYVPSEIVDLTNSCNQPIQIEGQNSIEPCGVCYKCLWDQKVFEMKENGYSVQHINAWRRLKSLEYGGNTGISAPMRAWLPVELGRGKYFKNLRNKKDIIEYVNSTPHYSLTDKQDESIWST